MGGLTPTNFIVSDYDRAAPNGTGAAKVGGNYAASLLPGYEAHQRKFSDCIYLIQKRIPKSKKSVLLTFSESRLTMNL